MRSRFDIPLPETHTRACGDLGGINLPGAGSDAAPLNLTGD
jgi:hypothetical protein